MGAWRVQVGRVVLGMLLLGVSDQAVAESEGERLAHALGLVGARLARLDPEEREGMLARARARLAAALPGQTTEGLEAERQRLTWPLFARLAPSPPPQATPRDPRLLAQYLQIIQIIVDPTVPVYPVCRDCPRRPVGSGDPVGVVDMVNPNTSYDRTIRSFEASHGAVFDGVAAVQVRRPDGTQRVVGTAVAVENGHLVTSAHVVRDMIGAARAGTISGMLRYVLDGADGRAVRLIFGRRDLQHLREEAGLRVVELMAGQAFAIHPQHDVAVFRVEGLAGLAGFRLGQTQPTRWSLFGGWGFFGGQQNVLVVGYPSEARDASPGELDKVYGIRQANRIDTPLKILRLAPGQTAGGWCPRGVPDCLTYIANTLPGNSGSAVVSPGDAVLLAIHRSGPDEGLARVNAGVRVEHLRELLAALP